MIAKRTWTYPAVLKRIIDVDTVVVDIDQGFRDWKHDQHIRVYRLKGAEDETPEGRSAADWLRSVLPIGSRLEITTLMRDPEVSGSEVRTFERWVASVQLLGGVDLAEFVAASGYGSTSG